MSETYTNTYKRRDQNARLYGKTPPWPRQPFHAVLNDTLIVIGIASLFAIGLPQV